MRALVLTNEFPPDIYGGAGVHVDELTRHLRDLVELDVRTFGSRSESAEGWTVRGYPVAHDLSAADERLRPMLSALSRDLGMVADPVDADVVHVHTWYTHLAGLLVRLAYGIPLALTVHSLEPLRPWKREQLGASAVGGIPEVVVDGETGLLVPVELRLDDPMSPVDPDRFERNLAGAINTLMTDAGTRELMGRAGRRRAVEHFGWSAIARQTADLYASLIR